MQFCIHVQYERGRELADFVKYLNDKCGTHRLPGGKLNPEVHCIYMINQTSRRLNKAKQIKSTRPSKSFFQENWLPQVGFEPMTLCSLDRVLSHVHIELTAHTCDL